VTLDRFLSNRDASRIRRVLEKLKHHKLQEFALTGSIALEIQMIGLGRAPRTRALNDLDIVVESFASIPSAMTKDFLVRHIHPNAPKGRIVIQLVDAEETLRIDVFSTYGATMRRTRSVQVGNSALVVVSLEDLAARAAALLMDLTRRSVVPRKHASDFRRLRAIVDLNRVEAAWRDHRKPNDPVTFSEASSRITDLIQSRGDLLVEPEYCRDVDAVCPKCQETEHFRVTSPVTIMSILGYC
jgi:hypothetical protein